MAAAFEKAAVVDYTPFGMEYLTPDQIECNSAVCDLMNRITSSRGRARYLPELTVCIGGMAPEDEGEPLEPERFSTREFWRVYVQDLISGDDKFDYLLCCIEANVCVVAVGYEDAFREILQDVLSPPPPKSVSIMGALVGEESQNDSEKRVELSCKEKLQKLEAEQAALEHSRRKRVFPHWRPCSEAGEGFPPPFHHH
eukprot:Hpha_TRINITY_DN20316_c0_g1::TRINITY_DN20316_c0_g1_i1::g.138175::m.138175